MLSSDHKMIQPDESICSDKTLIRTHFEFSEIVPDYEVMVYEMAKWIKKCSKYRSHFFIIADNLITSGLVPTKVINLNFPISFLFQETLLLDRI